MISRKNRDVKFIIYQSLYIFVIAVLALKGANLDLTEVVKKDTGKTEEKNYTDSLRTMIDSLMARGIIPEIKYDTSQKYSDPVEFQRKIAEKQREIAMLTSQINSNPSFSVDRTSPNIQQKSEKEKTSEEKSAEKEQSDENKKKNIDLVVPQSFKQFTTNSISNPSDEPIEIYGSDGSLLATVPSKGSRNFTLGSQTSLTFKRGGVSKTVATIENAKPKILMQRLVPSGEEVSIRTIQSTVGYRVTIVDDNPGQLDVKFTGPVNVKQSGPLVYDVTLNFLGSKTAFENYADSRDAPYTVTFQVTVKDKIATQHTIIQSGAFQFGEW